MIKKCEKSFNIFPEMCEEAFFEDIKNGNLSLSQAMKIVWERGYQSKQEEDKLTRSKEQKELRDLVVNQKDGFIPLKVFVAFYVSIEDELKKMNEDADDCCKSYIENILDFMNVKIGNFKIDKRLLASNDICKSLKK